MAEDIATELARALQLPGTNRTLGRKFVGFGLSALRDYSSDAEAALSGCLPEQEPESRVMTMP